MEWKLHSAFPARYLGRNVVWVLVTLLKRVISDSDNTVIGIDGTLHVCRVLTFDQAIVIMAEMTVTVSFGRTEIGLAGTHATGLSANTMRPDDV